MCVAYKFTVPKEFFYFLYFFFFSWFCLLSSIYNKKLQLLNCSMWSLYYIPTGDLIFFTIYVISSFINNKYTCGIYIQKKKIKILPLVCILISFSFLSYIWNKLIRYLNQLKTHGFFIIFLSTQGLFFYCHQNFLISL